MNFQKTRMITAIPFYIIINFFILKYLLLLFTDVNNWYMLGISVILAIIHLIPIVYENDKSTKLGRLFAEFSGVWTWILMFLAMDVVAIYIIDYLYTLPVWLKCAILCIVPILAVYNYYHAHKLVIKEKTIKLDNLKEEVNLIHFSDVHFGSIRHRKIIRLIADALKNLSSTCDIAIISGDLADGTSAVEEDDFLDFKEVEMPIIFTPGNHDFYPGIDNVLNACRNAGILILDNESLEFKGLNIYGRTFTFGSGGPRNLENPLEDEKLYSAVNKDSVNIMVYHIPSYWEEFSKIGYDIQLSGHTHGGQFYPAVWLCKLLFGYNKGIFKHKDSYLHVTTGVGSMGYPMRWGTDSELVILKLRKK